MFPRLIRVWLFLALALGSVRAETALDQGYRGMYNLEFESAHRLFRQWMGVNPADPLGPASDAAAYLFAEFDRLHVLESELFTHDEKLRDTGRLSPDPALAAAFKIQLRNAEVLAGGALSRNAQDTNALFALVLVDGLTSDYQGLIEKSYLKSLSAAKSARRTAERLLAIDPHYYDAWLAIGVENYMLGLKPLPVRWILQLSGSQADRAVGLEKLRLTAEQGRYLKPFARLLQAVAAMREKDHARARMILGELAAQYPANHLYSRELARLPD
jgi:hypothetical protein